jgi:hypothetical protein
LAYGPWPGTGAVVTIDPTDQLGMNLSGLAYLSAGGGQPAALLAVQNGPPKLHRFTSQGSSPGSSVWRRDSTNGWGSGKTLRYPGGKGEPDAEAVTLAGSNFVAYVATESDASAGSSRLSVLRFDLTGTQTTLTATHEWNLTGSLPSVDTNLGLEAIAWVPDEHLVSRGFLDENTGAAYDPARYTNHGNGLFFVGLEDKGTIYAYALDHQTQKGQRLAIIVSGQGTLADVAFDADNGVLLSACDDTCSNRITLLGIDTNAGSKTRGRFVPWRGLARPATLPNTNNEGITFAPVSECGANRQRSFFWADDANKDGHALRMGAISCDPLF